MQNPPTDRYAPSTSANKYSASVPISVYRELAAELQAAQATIDSLKAQNQNLVKQNHQLQQQVDKVVQSAQHLQQIVSSFGVASHVEVPRSKSVRQPEARPVTLNSSPRPAASNPTVEYASLADDSEPDMSPYSETVVIEQEEPRARRSPQSEGGSDVSGWMLVVAILLIVLTAFGTGFLIVRPLLNSNKR
jgi:cobalamin biosynthesis Mg chelatase CobN